MNKSSGYIQVPGGKVWFERIGREKGIPLLILHGGPGYPHDYLEVLGQLSSKRQIIFYDQLGCGNSDYPKDKKLWKIERFVQELKTVICELNLRQFHLFGHSWGTMLGVDFALTAPEGLKSLILASPIIKISLWEKTWQSYRKKLQKNLKETLKFYESKKMFYAPGYLRAVDEFYKYHVCRLDTTPLSMQKSAKKSGGDCYTTMWGPNEFTCTGNLRNYDQSKSVKKVNLPILITCGKYDGADPESCKYYQKLIPNSKLKVFIKSAHMPHLEQTKEYLQTLTEFLNKVESKGE